jgi:hypothetical protein
MPKPHQFLDFMPVLLIEAETAHGLSVTALYRMLGLKQSSSGVGGLRVRKSLEARCHGSGPLLERLL